METASGYLDACESAYLLFGVPFFAYSERKRAAYNRKFYPVDTGLRWAVITPGAPDHGKSLASFYEAHPHAEEARLVTLASFAELCASGV